MLREALNVGSNAKSEKILMLLTLILWFQYCVRPSWHMKSEFSLPRISRRQTFFYYYDVVNDTTTKDLSSILSDTQKHILRANPCMQITRSALN